MKKRPAPRKRKLVAAKPKAKESSKKTEIPASLLPILENAAKNWRLNQPIMVLSAADKAGCLVEFVNWLTSAEKSEGAVERVEPEELGFTLHDFDPGLFSIYVRGKDVLVEMEPALAEVEMAVLRGRGTKHWLPKHQSAIKLEKALEQVSVYYQARKGGFAGLNQRGKKLLQQLALQAVEMMGEAFSPHLEEFNSAIWTMLEHKEQSSAEKTYRRAEQAAGSLRAVFKRASEGMMRTAFHAKKRARGSGEDCPKELLAIRHAQILCGQLRELPTKTDVKRSLSAIGVGYIKDRNENTKWDKLFEMAGLGGLPD